MTKLDEKQARTWAMFCHLSALAVFLGIPFGNILGPLVIWLIKKDESAFVDDQGKEALNFQISITIYFFAALLLMFIIIGIPIMIGLGIFQLIIVIVAAVKANNGEKFRYPVCIRFIQ